MNERDEQRILDLLYEEVEATPAELQLSAEEEQDLAEFRDVLARVRTLPDDEPSSHLDSLILAQARVVAEQAELARQPWWRRFMSSRGLALAMAATATLFVAVLVVPELRMSSPALYESEVAAPAQQAAPAAAPSAAEPLQPKTVAAMPAEDYADGELDSALGKKQAPALDRPEDSAERSRRAAASAPRPRGRAVAQRPEPLARSMPAKRSADPRADGPRPISPDAVGTLSGSGGVASARDKDRAGREEGAALGDMVTRAKAKEEAKREVAPEAEAEVVAEKPAPPPPPASAPGAARSAPAPKPAADSGGAKAGESRAPSAGAATADSRLAALRTRARLLEAQGDVEGARKYLLGVRRSYVGTPMYEQVSYELAELELRHRRPAQAEAYARDVLTTKDENLAARARALIQRARSQGG